jgi:hypothetical protein
VAENNIKVNWIVNTADVERAKQILAQADQVGNKFQQTATKAGNDTAKSFGNAQKSVDDMRLRLTEIKKTMETLPLTATKRLATYSAEYKKLDAEIKKVTKDLYDQEKAQKAVATSANQTTQQFGQMYTAIKTIIAAGLAKEAINTALEMAKLAGNVEGVERAFRRAFPNAKGILNDVRAATHGTVSDFELMQRTLQASNLGVSAEKLGVLFEFAATRAQQTGESVDYLVDSVVRGIGRKSLVILDNLGLSATRLREQFNGAALASKSVAEVTEGVAQIAQVELNKMGGYAETSATKVDQLTVSWQKLKEEVSKTATQEGGAVDFLKSYVDTYAQLFEAINKGVSVQELINQKRREEFAQMNVNAMMTNLATASKEEQIKAIEDEIAAVTKSVGSWMQFRDEMNKNIEAIKKEYEGRWDLSGVMNQEIRQTERIRDAKLDDTKVEIEIIKLLHMKLQALKEIKKVQEEVGLIEAKQNEIESVEDKIKAAKSTAEIHKLNNELAILNGQLADLKAFGTTKQSLEVNAQIKLVPVIDPKGWEKTIKQTPLLNNNTSPVTKEFLTIDGKLVVKELDTTKIKFKDTGRGATDQLEDYVQGLIDNMRLVLPAPVPASTTTTMSEWEKIGQEFADNWQNILNQGIGDTTAVIDAAIQKEADAYSARINQAQAYYDELMILAGDNEKEKDRLRLREMREIARLRREAFEADKRAKRSQAVINGAAGVVNAFATLPYPAALVASVLIAAQTAAQIAIINAEQPRFAKGVIDLKGPGSKTSDSIPARLSKGESVMTADETGSSMGILKDIRAGKLNDKLLARQLDSGILKDLKLSKNGVTYVGGQDDTRIVNKLDQLINSQPDFEEKNGLLWKTRKKSENYKQWVRAKIM